MNPPGIGDSQDWKAGAFIWSGSRDPEWEVSAADALAAMSIWNRLEVAQRWTRPPSRLGYRGCWLRGIGAGRWTVEADLVLMAAAAGGEVLQARRDPNRSFERTILATAPRGLLPSNLIGSP